MVSPIRYNAVSSGKLKQYGMQRRIVGFHQDEDNNWVADLECGHTRHVRHDPPWTNRPWVATPDGRQHFLGRELECKDCDKPDKRSGTL
jgi:hypothetical protein